MLLQAVVAMCAISDLYLAIEVKTNKMWGPLNRTSNRNIVCRARLVWVIKAAFCSFGIIKTLTALGGGAGHVRDANLRRKMHDISCTYPVRPVHKALVNEPGKNRVLGLGGSGAPFSTIGISIVHENVTFRKIEKYLFSRFPGFVSCLNLYF